MSIVCSEYVFVALVIQHEMCMCHIILSVSCPSVSYFLTLSHKQQDFKEKIQHITYVLISSSTLSELFFILRRIQRGIAINVPKSSCKVPDILVKF